jgi:hypothetical protein
MQGTARAKDQLSGWSFGASALLHVLACAIILLLPDRPQFRPPQEQSVDVEIVTLPPPVEEKHELPQQVSPSETGEAPQDNKPEDRPETPTIPQAAQCDDETPAMVKPSRMLSEKVLADPRSRKARKELAALAPADQIEQLCGLEAMAQVGAWSKELRPDRIVAYATADPKIEGNAFSADGAALHSKRDWFELKFRCELTPDHKKVAAFEFLMGDPIPRKDWADHSLPDEGGSLD